jgi:hypothetical protein
VTDPFALGARSTRRAFLASLGMAAAGVACTAAPRRTPAPPDSIQALLRGLPTASLIGSGSDAPPMVPGPNRFGFLLVDPQGRVAEGGAPEVRIARSPTSPASRPVAAVWRPFTAYEKTGDRSPRSNLPGSYVANIDLPGPGNWSVAAILRDGARPLGGSGILPVAQGAIPGAVGVRAKVVATPVATTDDRIAAICTRTPVDHLHAVSLDSGLRSGKPTVACFSTPLLCQSQLCGPVTDEVILAAETFGIERANFIHVEEFLPGPHHHPPSATFANRSPGFKAWGLETEPWVFVIDRTGTIRFRALGPVTAPEILDALSAVA